MEDGPPRPGHLVKVTAPEWSGTEVYHTLYLPPTWQKGRKYPVIVEYAGNSWGAVCTGKVEDCKLGFYESGGQGFILMALPFINAKEKKNQLNWWGDVDATVQYCELNVKRMCEKYGGDPSEVFLTGFSRGAIACGYIGLHDDTIAQLWAGLIPFAHFDGGSFTRAGAETRLARIKGKPVLIIYGEKDDAGKANSLAGAKILQTLGEKPTLLEIPGMGHTDTWIMSASLQRTFVREWLDAALKKK
jgi:predicted esterase